jgi:hypothetical protein
MCLPFLPREHPDQVQQQWHQPVLVQTLQQGPPVRVGCVPSENFHRLIKSGMCVLDATRSESQSNGAEEARAHCERRMAPIVVLVFGRHEWDWLNQACCVSLSCCTQTSGLLSEYKSHLFVLTWCARMPLPALHPLRLRL